MSYDDALLGINTVQHDDTLTGDGTAGAPLGIAEGGVGADQLPAQVVTAEKLADAAVTVHKLAPRRAGRRTPGRALRADPLEAFFKIGENMFWSAAFTGDITEVNTPAGSGLTGGVTEGGANLAIAPLGVTNAMLADQAVTAAKLGADLPADALHRTLKRSSGTGVLYWGVDGIDMWPYEGVYGDSPVEHAFRITSVTAETAIVGEANAGTGLRGKTLTGRAASTVRARRPAASSAG